MRHGRREGITMMGSNTRVTLIARSAAVDGVRLRANFQTF